MKHVIDKIEVADGEIRLIDSYQGTPIRVLESTDGTDIIFMSGGSYFIVDSKLFLGSLKSLVALGERERINSRPVVRQD